MQPQSRDNRQYRLMGNNYVLRPEYWKELKSLYSSHVPSLYAAEVTLGNVHTGLGADVPTVMLCRHTEPSTVVRKLPIETPELLRTTRQHLFNEQELRSLYGIPPYRDLRHYPHGMGLPVELKQELCNTLLDPVRLKEFIDEIRPYGFKDKPMSKGAIWQSKNLTRVLRHELQAYTDNHGWLNLDIYKLHRNRSGHYNWHMNCKDFLETILANSKSRLEICFVFRTKQFPLITNDEMDVKDIGIYVRVNQGQSVYTEEGTMNDEHVEQYTRLDTASWTVIRHWASNRFSINLDDALPVHCTKVTSAQSIDRDGLKPGYMVPNCGSQRRFIHMSLRQPADVGATVSGAHARDPIWVFIRLRHFVDSGNVVYISGNGVCLFQKPIPRNELVMVDMHRGGQLFGQGNPVQNLSEHRLLSEAVRKEQVS